MSRIIRGFHLVIYFLALSIFISCSAPRYITLDDAEEESEVKIYKSDGKVMEGIITSTSDSGVVLISGADHESHVLSRSEIRRIEETDKNYDFQAYPISDAEIEKYKSNRHAWVYAVGGIFVGGLLGITAGLPLWYADTGIPPYFTGGIGAVAGSIFFGIRGTKKDRQVAVETIRYLRKRERKVESEKAAEERRIEELKKEADKLREKLKQKEE